MLLLGVRFRCTDMIGELKQNHGMDLVDPKREPSRSRASAAWPKRPACRPRWQKPSCAR